MVSVEARRRSLDVGIQEWMDDLRHKPHMTIQDSLELHVTLDQHLGPAWLFAGLDVVVQPHDGWAVSLALPEGDGDLIPEPYIRGAIYGFMDVLLLQPHRPVLNLHVTLTGFRYDPVNSSAMAFRLAGRMAGRQLLERVRLA